jgi:hypothetical protein
MSNTRDIVRMSNSLNTGGGPRTRPRILLGGCVHARMNLLRVAEGPREWKSFFVANSELFARIADEVSRKTSFAWPDEPAWSWLSLDVSVFYVEGCGW